MPRDNEQLDERWYSAGEWVGWLVGWALALGIIASTVFVIVAALVMLHGCGGSGGDVNAAKGTTLASGTPGTAVTCDFGDNNTFSFVLGDNAALDFCTQGGGTVQPDNSSVSQPTNSGNKTTNNVVPTPTPGGA